ncbi:MAG: hypothetical protein QM706_01095 [Nitrospira sp.]
MEQQRDELSLVDSPTILAVDSERSSLSLCKAILEGAGFTVLEADGSSDALKICTQHSGPIDLLLTELVLPPPEFQLASSSNPFPHVNGQELAIRAAKIRSGLRIILMSGNPEKELASHGFKLGIFPFLSKPFEIDHLVTAVQQVLAQPSPTLTSEPRSGAANETSWYG